MTQLKKLQEIRDFSGKQKTVGLSDDVIRRFLDKDPALQTAIDMAHEAHGQLKGKHAKDLAKSETEQIEAVQKHFVNFYTDDTINPYVSLAAKGPWVITTCGAVLHDSGGYGMLGMGHAPDKIMAAMCKPHVMANIMTPNFAQAELAERLIREIGHSREDKPFTHFLCLNSGSESVTVASRFSDINAANLTAKGALHAGKTSKFLALTGGFHGRTDRPAQVSDSSLPKYRSSLLSFKGRENLVTVKPNDIDALKQAFADAEKNGIFFESFFMEPVMGEGNPGVGVTPEFYQVARELTAKNQTLLIMDSIQAGLRAHGCLSIVDYPGFQKLDPPDIETYSKAVNAGQYPLSVLAVRDQIAQLYVKGVYGNTMTTNPRALEVACAVLDSITPAFRKNIQEMGKEFVTKLKKLQEEFPEVITGVTGTGLLCAAHINPSKHKVVGFDCLEEKMRKRGIGVIHGGENALRFTPHFAINSDEIDLIIEVMRAIISEN